MPKLPPWAWALIAVGLGGAIYLYKKHEEALTAAVSKEGEGEAQPEIAGVENAAEEFPYTIAGLGGGGAGGAIGNAGESEAELQELFKSQTTQNQEFEKGLLSEQTEGQKSIAELISSSNKSLSETIAGALSGFGSELSTIAAGSGGGAPASSTGGVTTAAPAKSAPAAPSCPSSFPNPNGTPSAHNCYKDGKCGNGCEGHFYQDGHSECQVKSGGKCQW